MSGNQPIKKDASAISLATINETPCAPSSKPKASANLQNKPCYSGLFNNEQIIFEEDDLLADGNCGLHGLGISREKAVALLLDNKNNKEMRDLVAPEIMAAAVEEKLPASLTQDQTMQAVLKTFYKEDQGSKESKASRQARERLLGCCSDLVVYTTFITDYLGKGGWLTYNRSTDIRQTTSIDALAKLRQIRVYIWQKSEKDITTVQLVHDSETPDHNGAVHLLHTAGGTHYNLLSMPTLTSAPQQADPLLQKDNLSVVAEEQKVAHDVTINESKESVVEAPPRPPAEHPALLPSGVTSSAQPAAQETFLQRAKRDYQQCQTIVDNLKATIFTTPFLPNQLFPESRRDMVNLMARRIETAEKNQYDDELYVTYQTVAEMMREWYFANNLKRIINATLDAIHQGTVVRQPLKYPPRQSILVSAPIDSKQATPLQEQNDSLQKALDAKIAEATKTASDHAEELKAKSDQIVAKEERIDQLVIKVDNATNALLVMAKSVQELVTVQKQASLRQGRYAHSQQPRGRDPSEEGEVIGRRGRAKTLSRG